MITFSDSQIVCEVLKVLEYIPASIEQILAHFSDNMRNRVISIIDNMAACRIICLTGDKYMITLGNGRDSDQYEYVRNHERYRKNES